MWNRPTFSHAAGITLAIILILATQDTLSEPPSVGKITYLRGMVEAYRHNTWTPLTRNSGVYQGEMIRTGGKSRLEIVFSDESTVRLGSQSKILIKEAIFKSEGEKKFSTNMLKGQAYAVASKLIGGESRFQFTTSNAIAGVRGTTFRIDAKIDKSTVVRVYTGAVAVSNAPIYAKPGKPKTTGEFEMPKKGVKPGGPGRREVPGPHEVTKQEWEEFVAKAMQEIQVAANGEITEPISFDAESDAADEWVAWNKSRDRQPAE